MNIQSDWDGSCLWQQRGHLILLFFSFSFSHRFICFSFLHLMMMMSRTTRTILIMLAHSGAWWWLSHATHKCATEWVSGVLAHSPLSSFTFSLLLFSLFFFFLFLFFLLFSFFLLLASPWVVDYLIFLRPWVDSTSFEWWIEVKREKEGKNILLLLLLLSLSLCRLLPLLSLTISQPVFTLLLQVGSIYPLLLRASVTTTSLHSRNVHTTQPGEWRRRGEERREKSCKLKKDTVSEGRYFGRRERERERERERALVHSGEKKRTHWHSLVDEGHFERTLGHPCSCLPACVCTVEAPFNLQ